MVIVISHLGLEQDKYMAKSIQKIDVIIGEHSHSVLEECLIENKTIICQTGHYGNYLGKLELVYNINEKKIEEFKILILEEVQKLLDSLFYLIS